jgi:hypothetical protein
MRLDASNKKIAAKMPRNEEKLSKSEKDFDFINSESYRGMTELTKNK